MWCVRPSVMNLLLTRRPAMAMINLMVLIWIQTLIISIIPAVNSETGLLGKQHSNQQTTVPVPTLGVNQSECWSSVNCKNTKRRPVCGTDGRTYSSKCQLKMTRKCDERNVDVLSNGRCVSLKDGRRLHQCLEERRQTLVSPHGSRTRPGVYVPECQEDGTFSPVQCHPAAGYCWCVTPDGKPIPETSVRGTDVRCRDKGYQRDPAQKGSKIRRGVRTKSCSPLDRVEFNKNLVRIFSEEYARDPSVDKTKPPGPAHDSDVIHWKFLQLDEDRDGRLRRGDVRTLKNMLKKLVKPRKCAKTFDTHCDFDVDGRIGRAEWAGCLGGDITALNKKRPGKISKSCSISDRSKFNRQLVNRFLLEYNEKGPGKHQDGGQNAPSASPNTLLGTPERRAISWKFLQLDSDRDGRLRREEIRPLKEEVKSSMKPKSCAKTMDIHCDLDDNQFILASEWSVCMGLDINNAPTGDAIVPGDISPADKNGGGHGSSAQKALFDIFTSGTSPLSPAAGSREADLNQIVSTQERRSTDPPDEESILDSGCVKARSHFLENHRKNPDANIFVPICLENGQYRKEQCHNATGFCWCVDQTTGRPIPTTSTRNVMPNCTNVKIREFKGCSYPMRRRFITKLLDQLTTDMMDFAHNTSDRSPMLDNNPDLTLEERAVQWKLRMLDKNNNQRLERQELKQFKGAMRMRKDLRKCSRNFLRYCDENDDGGITLPEWTECTGIHEQQRNLPDNTKGTNPFTEYLKGHNDNS